MITLFEYSTQVREEAAEIIKDLCEQLSVTYDELVEDHQEELDERVNEEVESSCIYTHDNLATIIHSSNWLEVDTFDDDCGKPEGESFLEHLNRAAFHAYKADLMVAIQNYNPDKVVAEG